MGPYNPKEIEPQILDYWKDNKTYERIVQKNKDGKTFYYLDGPPYTTGKIHIGHAWGKALRDQILRYKRMTGHNVWDRPGFDMHGLPIEVSVEKELGIKDKHELTQKIGLAKFTKACEKYALEQLWPMVEDFKRLGIWLNWKDPYMTIKNEYIEGAWWALKKAHEKNLLYKGKKSMTWCPRCATALAKHELEYADRSDESIYVKFKMDNGEHLIIWTTTPWTIPFNMAVMVHPEYDYARVKVNDETWIIAEELVEEVLAKTKNEGTIINTLLGKELAGKKYTHPLNDIIPAFKKIKAHIVVLSDKYVTLDAGTGLVHCAPGCGPEDFDVGKQNNLPPFNETDENGAYTTEMGEMAGKKAKEDDKYFIELLTDKNALVGKGKIKHEYAHCWRCKTPVIFRATDQWFLATEKLRDQMREQNKNINWVPDWAGNKWFDSWLSSLQDWCISRQRFWGVPLPIWECNCGKIKVIGTRKELPKQIEDIHRPYIDEIKLKCDCGKEMQRVPDVLDVWLDSGVGPWATLNYPSEEKQFKTLGFPDLILEGKDQIRGWFNSLTCMSMISFGKIPFKAVYMHGFINDSQGRKMSKSLKNFITPYEITDVYGADTMRYYQIGGAQPGIDLNFNHDDAKIKYRNLGILWNLKNFVIDLAKELKINPEELDDKIITKQYDTEERYIMSLMNSAIQKITDLYDEYRLNEIPAITEQLYLTLSRTYIQMVRDKASIGDEREIVLYTVYNVLKTVIKLMAPITPFITEAIWQELKQYGLKENSIHETEWPKANKKQINKELEQEMEIAQDIIQATMASREKAKINLRWPLPKIHVVLDNTQQKAIEQMEPIIKNQTNIKEIHTHDTFTEINIFVKPNPSPIGKQYGKDAPKIIQEITKKDPNEIASLVKQKKTIKITYDGKQTALTTEHLLIDRDVPKHYIEMPVRNGFIYLDTRSNDELETEGYARELMRRVQEMRKQANYTKTQQAKVYIKIPEEMETLDKWKDKIAEKCNATVKIGKIDPVKKHETQTELEIKGNTFTLYLDHA